MTPKLPSMKPKDVIKILKRAGFVFIRQKGSHKIFIKDDKCVIVPFHNQDLKRGTLQSIIDQSGLDIDMFTKKTK